MPATPTPTPTTTPAPAYFSLVLPAPTDAPPGARHHTAHATHATHATHTVHENPAPTWTKIDQPLARTLALGESDLCFYHRVRTPGGIAATPTNALIAAFKCTPAYASSHPAARARKHTAAHALARALAAFLARPDVAAATELFAPTALVPMPTHLPKAHPLHDMRLAYICALAAAKAENVHPVDAFDTAAAHTPAHSGGTRDPRALKARFTLRPLTTPQGPPRLAILVDDVITTGAHFAACRALVRDSNPDLPVIGAFLAIHRSAKIGDPGPL